MLINLMKIIFNLLISTRCNLSICCTNFKEEFSSENNFYPAYYVRHFTSVWDFIFSNKDFIKQIEKKYKVLAIAQKNKYSFAGIQIYNFFLYNDKSIRIDDRIFRQLRSTKLDLVAGFYSEDRNNFKSYSKVPDKIWKNGGIYKIEVKIFSFTNTTSNETEYFDFQQEDSTLFFEIKAEKFLGLTLEERIFLQN